MQLPVTGQTIARATFDGAFSVFIEIADGHEFRIGGRFEISVSGVTYALDPDLSSDGPHLDRLPALVGLRVLSAEADDDTGALRLRCDGDASVVVPASEDFETWELSDHDGTIAVATPGGELAVWDRPG